MKKDKIIIFGASGFIGTYLIDSLLNKNYQVLAIDSDDMLSDYYLDKKIEFLQLDLRDSKKFNEIDSTDCTAVIQLAALQPSNYDPYNLLLCSLLIMTQRRTRLKITLRSMQ